MKRQEQMESAARTYEKKMTEKHDGFSAHNATVGFYAGWKAADESLPYTDEDVRALARALTELLHLLGTARNSASPFYKERIIAERILEAE